MHAGILACLLSLNQRSRGQSRVSPGEYDICVDACDTAAVSGNGEEARIQCYAQTRPFLSSFLAFVETFFPDSRLEKRFSCGEQLFRNVAMQSACCHRRQQLTE